MERWRASLVVCCAAILVLFPPKIQANECTLDVEDGVKAKGVLVPADQCDTYQDRRTNELHSAIVDGSTTVCCPVFQNEPNCGRISMYDGVFSHDSRESQLDQFPWAVVIMKRWVSVSICSGSLISRQFVLSAAHCFVVSRKKLLPERYRVRLGEWDLNLDEDCQYVEGRLACNDRPPTDIPVEIIVNHKLYDYKSQGYLYDIALLKLIHPAEYSALISPVCLPSWSKDEPTIAGRNFTATGWGKTHSFMALRRKLKIHMKGHNVTVCRRAYSMPAPEVPQLQLCVGGERNRDTCFGDSGGALMRRKDDDGDRWTQVGIISFGGKTCGTGIPGVFTNVAFFLDWIQRVMHDLSERK